MNLMVDKGQSRADYLLVTRQRDRNNVWCSPTQNGLCVLYNLPRKNDYKRLVIRCNLLTLQINYMIIVYFQTSISRQLFWVFYRFSRLFTPYLGLKVSCWNLKTLRVSERKVFSSQHIDCGSLPSLFVPHEILQLLIL